MQLLNHTPLSARRNLNLLMTNSISTKIKTGEKNRSEVERNTRNLCRH